MRALQNAEVAAAADDVHVSGASRALRHDDIHSLARRKQRFWGCPKRPANELYTG